jgi:hypothetical protein
VSKGPERRLGNAALYRFLCQCGRQSLSWTRLRIFCFFSAVTRNKLDLCFRHALSSGFMKNGTFRRLFVSIFGGGGGGGGEDGFSLFDPVERAVAVTQVASF